MRKITLQFYETYDRMALVRRADRPASPESDPHPVGSLRALLRAAGVRDTSRVVVTEAPKRGRFRLIAQRDSVFRRAVVDTLDPHARGNVCLGDLRELIPWARAGMWFNVRVTRNGKVARDA